MLPIAGQMAGPNGLKFFLFIFFQFFFSRATPGPSASTKYKDIRHIKTSDLNTVLLYL